MYTALVAELKNVRPHPNADRLKLADCFGEQVIVGLEDNEGDIGIYFPSGGRLSEDFCIANNLIGYTDPETGERKGGLFDDKRRVKAQKLRGESSYGFWCPLTYLSNFVKYIAKTKYNGDMITSVTDTQRYSYDPKTDTALVGVVIGDQITDYAGYNICTRYETPKTREAAQNNQKQNPPKPRSIWFPEHYDTSQFLYEIDKIPAGARIIITEKLHGTSARMGNTYNKIVLPWIKQQLNKIYPWFKDHVYKMSVGTRKTVLSDKKTDFYNDKNFRYNVVPKTELHPGEIVYGEIVGYTTNKSPIQGSFNPGKVSKEFQKLYGSAMAWSYGCEKDSLTRQQALYVYRIRIVTPEIQKELSFDELSTRCFELGLNTVPVLADIVYDGNKEALKELVVELSSGASVLDTHCKEGVVLRVETTPTHHYALKYKTPEFKMMESHSRDIDTFIDQEESN